MTDIAKQRENVTSGPIARTVFSLAIPVAAGTFMEFALGITDFYWVGKLGAEAQDAVTSSMVIMWTVFALISIISVGVTALVSRYVGAKDYTQVSFYIKQGIALALGIGSVVAVAGFVLAPYLLKFMDTSAGTFAMAVPYIRIFFASSILFFLIDTIYAIFRASGNTRTPTLVGVGAVIINIILDPMFIFGIGPFPRLGVAGAAVATTIAILIATLAITVMLLRGKLGYRVEKLFSVKPKLEAMRKIGRIGVPMSIHQVVFVVVYWFLIKIVHTFGETAGAAMGIGNRMESLSYLTCFGFSVAASTMVGQNLGAGKPDRAARCAWGAIGLAVGITFFNSVLFILFPKTIASIFTNDPEVLKIAIDYLIILGWSQTAMAVEIVLEGAFSGAGDTIPPVIVMIPTSIARIPLAYLLAFTLGWGINGIWWTLTITSVVKAVVLALLFKRGRWKLKQV